MNQSKNQELLLAALRERRTEAYQEAMHTFGHLVMSVVGAMVSDRRDVEEDSFVKAFRSIDSYRADSVKFGTWLGRIAYNCTVDYLRHHMRRPDEVELMSAIAYHDSEEPEDRRLSALEMAVEKLMPEERTLITLVYFKEMSLADVAYIMQSGSAGALSSRLYRIRQKLAKIINETK